MAESSRYVAASLTAQNTFTEPLQIRLDCFNFSLSGTFVATVTIQRRFYSAGAWGSWFDVENYTAAAEDIGITPSEGVQYRAGIKTGNYTSGTAVIRISQ
jgi:hypothetical protein